MNFKRIEYFAGSRCHHYQLPGCGEESCGGISGGEIKIDMFSKKTSLLMREQWCLFDIFRL